MNPARRSFLRHAALALAGLALAPTLFGAPAERIHVVRRGDTLSSIASAHGVSVESIRTRNRLGSTLIKIGQRLAIPARPVPAPERPPAAAPSPPAGPPSMLAPVVAATRGLRIIPGRWTHLVVHHSGIEAGNARSYDGAHRRRGMENGLAYHFVIGNGRDSADGLIEVGPRWPKQLYGGHVRSFAMNDHGIGICLVGNFETRAPGKRQLSSLYSLLDWLRADGLPGAAIPKVTVHRWVDRNHTVCPGRLFPYPELKRRYGATP